MDPLHVWSMISRKRPTPIAENSVDAIPFRLTPFGELVITPAMRSAHLLADEGSYFTVVNPTILTGLATIAAPVNGADTEPFIIVRNADVVGGKRIFIDYIRLICTGAGTAGTRVRAVVKLDNISRYTSGSSLTTTPKNVNMACGDPSIAQIYAGPLVAAAASPNQRIIATVEPRCSLPVAGDEYVFRFGHEAPPSSAIKNGTTPITSVASLPPVVIGPGDSMLFHLYIVTQSAAGAYELDIGYWER